MKTSERIRGRRLARLADAPNSDLTECDKEAFDFLNNIYYSFVDIRAEGEPDDAQAEGDRNWEYAEGAVPYTDYKAANAYSQLGLYDYELEYVGMIDRKLESERVPESRILLGAIRNVLFDFALNALILLQESDDEF